MALARALVLSPSVLLLDEPLGALDAKLRRGLQVELKGLQRDVGITFLYVTHDQEEALTMSDRLAVMHGGRIQQLGTPREVYEEPATAFVADFLGVSNLMTGTGDGAGTVTVDGVPLEARAGDTRAAGDVRVTIRPERVELEPAGAAGAEPPALHRARARLPRLDDAGLRPDGERSVAPGARSRTPGSRFRTTRGDPVVAHLPPDALRALPADGSAS